MTSPQSLDFIEKLLKTCKKSQKGVYLQRQKSQKGVKYGRREISKRCKQKREV